MTLVLDDLRPEAAERARAALAKGEPVVLDLDAKPGLLMLGLFQDEPDLILEVAREAREARDRESSASRG